MLTYVKQVHNVKYQGIVAVSGLPERLVISSMEGYYRA